jgi:hypothetical protein
MAWISVCGNDVVLVIVAELVKRQILFHAEPSGRRGKSGPCR